MSKILVISNRPEINNQITEIMSSAYFEFEICQDELCSSEKMSEFLPDIAIIDTQSPNINIPILTKKLKMTSQTENIQVLLLVDNDFDTEEAKVRADGYILEPLSKDLLIATISAYLRIKKSLDILSDNNSELARSLYQLNVLYNTSSQLAGSLDKDKLINIMNEGLEKSLSYSLLATFITNNTDDIKLIIHSLHPITSRLEQAIKLRVLLGYKNLFEQRNQPFNIDIDDIKVIKSSKHDYDEYDLNIFHFDSIFSPISTSDKFFGTVELFREIELTGEDSTCFQTIIKQVSLPLESALLYEEIKQTNIKLEKLEKLKSEFISIVSHELRTPLTAIRNSLDIMLSGKSGILTDIMNKFLNMAKRNVTRLSGIINDLLDLSKIEAGKMDYRFKATNILEPVEFVKNTFEYMAQEKNISLTINTEDNLPMIYADSSRIEQVLSNLVQNAIKFTPNDGKINISASIIDAQDIDMNNFGEDDRHYEFKGSHIKVSVEDSGIGIAQDDIPKVFDKFQQIESSLSREVGGTGLGLPIAKQLLEAHRGAIWVESVINKGSTFSFVLPVMDSYNTFMLEINNTLQQSKYNHSNLTLMIIEEEVSSGQKSMLDDILQEKINIINKINKSKMYLKENSNVKELYIILHDADKFAVDFIKKKLEYFVNDDAYNYKNNIIKTGFAVYPENAISVKEMIEYGQRSLEKLKNTIKTEVTNG